jgi:hypothetical protein
MPRTIISSSLLLRLIIFIVAELKTLFNTWVKFFQSQQVVLTHMWAYTLWKIKSTKWYFWTRTITSKRFYMIIDFRLQTQWQFMHSLIVILFFFFFFYKLLFATRNISMQTIDWKAWYCCFCHLTWLVLCCQQQCQVFKETNKNPLHDTEIIKYLLIISYLVICLVLILTKQTYFFLWCRLCNKLDDKRSKYRYVLFLNGRLV